MLSNLNYRQILVFIALLYDTSKVVVIKTLVINYDDDAAKS